MASIDPNIPLSVQNRDFASPLIALGERNRRDAALAEQSRRQGMLDKSNLATAEQGRVLGEQSRQINDQSIAANKVDANRGAITGILLDLNAMANLPDDDSEETHKAFGQLGLGITDKLVKAGLPPEDWNRVMALGANNPADAKNIINRYVEVLAPYAEDIVSQIPQADGSTLGRNFRTGAVQQQETPDATTDIGKLRQDLARGIITSSDFTQGLLAITAKTDEDVIGKELDRETARLRNQRLQQEIADHVPPPTTGETAAASANLKRLSDLSETSAPRLLGIERAKQFLNAFTNEGAESGTTRTVASAFPGVFTKQGTFDETFDSFAELAARAALKAAGEIRPTDADVKGAKKALFGVGKNEDTNIRLLEDYIRQQEALEAEFTSLTSAKGGGTLGQLTPNPEIAPSALGGILNQRRPDATQPPPVTRIQFDAQGNRI